MKLLLIVGMACASSRTTLKAAAVADLEARVERRELVEDLGRRLAELDDPLFEARLELIFAKQVRTLREQAIERLRDSTADEYDTQCDVEADFCDAVKRSLPKRKGWDWGVEYAALSAVGRKLVSEKKRASDLQLEAARQQANYMRLYQTYNSRIQQLQASQFNRGLPLQAAFAYRLRDNVNLSGSYSQGKARLELQSIDDDTVLQGDPPIITAPSRGLGWSFNAS